MGTQQSILAYDDCLELMQQALDDPKGIRVEFPRLEDARNYRLRLNAARHVQRKHNALIYPDLNHPLNGKSTYDGLVFRLKKINQKFYVYLESTPYDVGKVEPLSGLPADEPAAEPATAEPSLPATPLRRRI